MSFMEFIRRRGRILLLIFLVIFVIGLFYGLTTGFDAGFTPGSRNTNQQSVRQHPTLVKDNDLSEAALRVNGRPVSQQVFDDLMARIGEQMRTMGGEDPSQMLDAYGYAMSHLVDEELQLQKAEELGIKLSGEDFEKAKADASAGFIESTSKETGNVVGDMVGKLADRRARNQAFARFLEVNGFTEDQWERSVSRDLLIGKVAERLKELAKEEKEVEVEKTKVELDKKLAEGKTFSELAREYSDGSTAASGGDLDWIGRGLLFDEKVTDAVFGTEVGKMTEWLEIPAGWQRFEVYGKKDASGPEFEKAKPGLIEELKKEHAADKDYVPADDEIAQKYEQARVRAIELHTTDAEGIQKELAERREAAVVEVNNPYVLAYQALRDSKLQPVAGIGAEQLRTIAQNAAVGEGYDYSLIDAKLAQARPDKEDAAAEDPAVESAEGGDAGGEPAAEGAGESEAADKPGDAAAEGKAPEDATTEDEAAEAVAETPEVTAPIYALGIGLLTKAIQDSGENQVDDFPYFLIAKTYLDWLKDDENLKKQPVNRDEARKQIEERLARVVEINNYSALSYAYRGLNLARMDKKTEAAEQLGKARQYAPQEEGDVWTTIREAYTVLDDQAKIAEVDKLLADFRQARIQEYLEQQMAQQEQQQAQTDLEKSMQDQGIKIDMDAAASGSIEGGE